MTEYAPTSVSKWTRPRGYDLWLCELTLHPLSLQYTLVCGALLEFQRYLREECSHTVEVEPREVALYVYGDSQRYIVIPQNAWTPDDHGTISHELHHATHLGLESNGITGTMNCTPTCRVISRNWWCARFLNYPRPVKAGVSDGNDHNRRAVDRGA